jgi:hypothetical protein
LGTLKGFHIVTKSETHLGFPRGAFFYGEDKNESDSKAEHVENSSPQKPLWKL